MRRADEGPYVDRVHLVPERVDVDQHPFSLPALRNLDLRFSTPVTFLVGENGCGKTTLLEAIATLFRFPAAGGGSVDLQQVHTPTPGTRLANALRPSRRGRPPDGYFFRADYHAYFATLLDERQDDPLFHGDPYQRYGGRSLHTRSHGESFLTLFENRVRSGLYLLDEPESALSPQRQIALLAVLAHSVRSFRSQFLIATHSPILMTFPGATLLEFGDDGIHPVKLEHTAHYQLTRSMLEHTASMWERLGANLEK